MTGVLAHCDTKSSHLQPVVMVDEGNTHLNIAGTFLITFDDQISLNGTPYVNHHGVLKKTPAVSAMAKINITEHHQLLSLPFLHESAILGAKLPMTPSSAVGLPPSYY